MKNKTIKVDYLARVEGEGSLIVKIKNGRVQDVKFKIFEPPRFFEAFLRGRMFSEAPDITARICGICPVAYMMSSCHAMEAAFGVQVDGQLRALRRLLYCGEWIESHVLHAFLLHAPDFLGYEDAIRMAKDYPEAVQKALRLKKIGNDIVNLVGGREIHPINVRVGGFYKTPHKKELTELLEPLKWALETSVEMVKLTATFEYPNFDREYEFVALRHSEEYPFNEGRIVSSKGLDIAVSDYEHHFQEEHVQHSNALHSSLKERGSYFVGPLARFNLNYDKLSPVARQVAEAVKVRPVVRNPFKSIIIRCIETVFAIEEAMRIIGEYEQPALPAVKVQPRAGVGCGCTEAPRGILFHRYTLDTKGLIVNAKIVPPTSQNQKTIESDLAALVPQLLSQPEERITWQLEQSIRNYDPCISCATHFLKLRIENE
ncbi:MAG: Ni/Fe hydrogenase subunit alpha [Ignavibacteriales bacterium]|nr:Ni/Fe hydrogenase subunit alpha [Ignavibacteriales bacterium]